MMRMTRIATLVAGVALAAQWHAAAQAPNDRDAVWQAAFVLFWLLPGVVAAAVVGVVVVDVHDGRS